MGGRDQSERLVAINRNSWSRSSRAPNRKTQMTPYQGGSAYFCMPLIYI
jgi:hypothetical protein